ncbi:MAG TPA: hypothetical protein VGA66_07055 [Mycobacterium sp.]
MRILAPPFAIVISRVVPPLLGAPHPHLSADQSTSASRTSASFTGLTSLVLPHGSVTLAETLPATEGAAPLSRLAPRPFCRVAATLRPSSDSDIQIEVWMPVTDWNQTLQRYRLKKIRETNGVVRAAPPDTRCRRVLPTVWIRHRGGGRGCLRAGG